MYTLFCRIRLESQINRTRHVFHHPMLSAAGGVGGGGGGPGGGAGRSGEVCVRVGNQCKIYPHYPCEKTLCTEILARFVVRPGKWKNGSAGQ